MLKDADHSPSNNTHEKKILVTYIGNSERWSTGQTYVFNNWRKMTPAWLSWFNKAKSVPVDLSESD